MDSVRAARAMRKPRKLRQYVGGGAGWYYVEEPGLYVVGEQSREGLFLSWRQIEQALAIRLAASATNREGAGP